MVHESAHVNLHSECHANLHSVSFHVNCDSIESMQTCLMPELWLYWKLPSFLPDDHLLFHHPCHENWWCLNNETNIMYQSHYQITEFRLKNELIFCHYHSQNLTHLQPKPNFRVQVQYKFYWIKKLKQLSTSAIVPGLPVLVYTYGEFLSLPHPQISVLNQLWNTNNAKKYSKKQCLYWRST